MSAPSSTASRRSDPGLGDDLFGFDGAAALIRAWSQDLDYRREDGINRLTLLVGV